MEQDPNQAEAWNLSGVLLERFDRPEEAREAYWQALSLDPNFSAARENLAALDEQASAGLSAIGLGWRSGLVFLLLFALAEGLGGYIQFSDLPGSAGLIANTLLQGLAGGLGLLWLGSQLKPGSGGGRFLAAGFAGFGIGYFLPHLIEPAERLVSDLPAAYLLVALRSAVQLVLAGLLAGLALQGRRLAVMLAVFGIISALYRVMLAVASLNILILIFLGDFDLLEPGVFQRLGWMQGLLLGGLSGFVVGMGFGWFARSSIQKN